MNILAFDTCFGACSVALSRVVRSEIAVPEARKPQVASRFAAMTTGHAERLVPMIGEVADEAGMRLDEVDRIIVTNGPGTFTGVRVGVAAGRALALATGAKVSCVGSLALLASQGRDRLLRERCSEVFGPGAAAPLAWMLEELAQKDIAIAIDARRGEIYFQLFGGDPGATLTEPLVVSPEQALTFLRARETIVFGSGAEKFRTAAEAAGRDVAVRIEDIEPNARYLLSFASAPVADPLRPLYLRVPDAKPQDGKALPRTV